MSDDSLHVVVFPWLAFGHMLPLLELSKALAKRGHRITYISTTRNIERLTRMQPDLSPDIRFLGFNLPPVEHLPEVAEATGDIPFEKTPYLKKAFDGLEAPFTAFLKSACEDGNTRRPDWIVMDFTHHWVPKIAAECRIPCTFFSVFRAPALVFFGPCSELLAGYRASIEDFTVPPKWVPFPSNVAYRYHEARTFLSVGEKNVSGVTDTERLVSVVNGSKFVCVRSCHNLEAKWLSLLSNLYGKEAMPVGLLPPPYSDGSLSENRTTNAGEVGDVMDWLDRQPSESVLYIAFGSEAALSSELLHELALGIEMSKVRFLWALRKPANIPDDAQILPDGFQERTKGSGFVTGWAPQMRVLAHASTGGFLTHCGWSSVIESFQFGHPLVQLPIFADQGLNARILEEKAVGGVIPRDEKTGAFSKEDVAKVVRLVMVDDEGKAIRRNARGLKAAFADPSSHEKHIDEFVEKLKELKHLG